MQFLDKLDTAIFLWLNSLHAPWLDAPMWWCSYELTWIPMYLVLLYAIWRRLRRRFVWFLSLLVMVIALSDQTASGLLKPTVKRLRPSHEPSLAASIHLVHTPQGELYRGGQYGFASSHAANTFGLAWLIWWLMGGAWVWLLCWAVVVSYSRIYLGVHYPLDILAGAGIGIVWASVAAQIFLGWARHKPPK